MGTATFWDQSTAERHQPLLDSFHVIRHCAYYVMTDAEEVVDILLTSA